MFELWLFPREGWVLFICFFVCFCILVYIFFLVKEKERKKKGSKLKKGLKYCFNSNVALRSVCAQDWAELFVFCSS